MARIQVQVDTEAHRLNYFREFKAAEPVIMLTHINDDDMADRRLRVAEAIWTAPSEIVYRQKPEFGAHVFVTVHGPVRYRYQGEEKWQEMVL